MAGAVASAMLFAFPVLAQDSRLSLADRVTRLEQQAQSREQSGTGLVNQIQQLADQMRQLQGQVEELQHQLQVLDDKNKAQYADLDARLARLEGGSAGNPQAPSASPTAAATAAALGSSTSNRPATTAGSDSADPAAAQAAYDIAFQSIRAGNYVAASREFRSFIQEYPNHPLVPNAWYWLGQSYFVTTNYSVALDAFKQLVDQFPQSDKLPDGLLKIGYCQIELKQIAAAQTTLKQVIAKYPGSDSASLAQERLQRLQAQSGN